MLSEVCILSTHTVKYIHLFTVHKHSRTRTFITACSFLIWAAGTWRDQDKGKYWSWNWPSHPCVNSNTGIPVGYRPLSRKTNAWKMPGWLNNWPDIRALTNWTYIKVQEQPLQSTRTIKGLATPLIVARRSVSYVTVQKKGKNLHSFNPKTFNTKGVLPSSIISLLHFMNKWNVLNIVYLTGR